MANGNAVPSFNPASPVRPNRNRSRSVGCSTRTSDASTGSVGASTAPSSTAAPSGKSSSHTPAAAISATVTAIDTNASRTGSHHIGSRSGTRSFNPAVNSETMTATSVTRSSNPAFSTGSNRISPSPHGPSPTPTSKYTSAVVSGSRFNTVPASATATSNPPTMMYQNVKFNAARSSPAARDLAMLVMRGARHLASAPGRS